jgi:hypothetical protein
MIRLIGSNVSAPAVARMAPAGYGYGPPGFARFPGRIFQGPGSTIYTTVYLLKDDPGEWFQNIVVEAGGTWTRTEDDEVI